MLKEEATGKDIYHRKRSTRHTWAELAEEYGLSETTLRRRVREYRKKNSLPDFTTSMLVNAMDEEPEVSGEELWARAISLQKRRERKQEYNANREVIFNKGPAVLVAMGDLHLGNSGVNYSDIDRDIHAIQMIAEAGVPIGVVLIGDLIDNFIIGRLAQLRMTESPFLAIEEWGLVDYTLQRLSPYIVGSVAGNHDNWSWALSGVDLLRERHLAKTPHILYDPYELAFTFRVGKFHCQVMARHSWSGHSKFNPTHGIDDHQRTRGREFDVAIGGHTHRGALAREFDNGASVGYAMLVGSYKKTDTLGKRIGLPPNLPTSSVSLIVTENGIESATSNLEAVANRFS